MSLIQTNVPLSTQCRFEVGGPADYFAAVSDEAQLRAALQFATERGQRVFVYSGGSNLFFADAGFRGLVIRVVDGGWRVEEREVVPNTYTSKERSSPPSVGADLVSARSGEDATVVASTTAGAGKLLPYAVAPVVVAGSGYDLPTLVRELATHNLGGIEFLGNIPGSVGGAVVGNAGCYGRAIAEVFVEADVFDIEEVRSFTAGPEFFEFSYRHSRLKFDPRYIVLSATLRLTARPAQEVLAEVEGELGQRLGKHPHFAACAGSFFKNPPGYPAWKVIADAGLTGASIGGARLHDKHANFLVSEGATAADVLGLARRVMRTVRDKLGLELEPEVRYVGEHGIEAI